MYQRFLRQAILQTPLKYPARWLLKKIRTPQGAVAHSVVDRLTSFHPQTFKSFDLPSGMTEDSLREVMLSFRIDDGNRGDLDPYVHDALFRFIHSWSLVKDEKGKCLEMGANPYFISWLLRQHTDMEITLANYFGGNEGKLTQTLKWDQDGKSHVEELECDHFNMEESRFPYEDNTFDVVLYCEIIEHLLMNPVHTLREIHRVLKPNGKLVVTTPNVARLGNVFAMVDGRSIYDPYSGYGVYGRHNREYSMHELIHLLKFCGFTEENFFTADAHREDHSHHPKFNETLPLVEFRQNDLGQYLFASVRATGSPQSGFPASLYRSYKPHEINNDW